MKELKDKLGDIGEKISNMNLVIVTLNGMLDECHIFITSLVEREKTLWFEKLISIILQ